MRFRPPAKENGSGAVFRSKTKRNEVQHHICLEKIKDDATGKGLVQAGGFARLPGTPQNRRLPVEKTIFKRRET